MSDDTYERLKKAAKMLDEYAIDAEYVELPLEVAMFMVNLADGLDAYVAEYESEEDDE